MQRFLSLSLTLIFVVVFTTASFAQLGSALRGKIKNAAKNALEDELNGGSNDTVEEPPADNTRSGNAVKGKKLTPPSVTDHLSSAESALKGEQYTHARYDIKEAMRGVELEIGYAILEMMPKQVETLTFNEENDGVTSSGIGFVGLVVSRVYGAGDKQVTASIGNNSMLGSTYGMLMSSNYTSTDEGNYKNIDVQGYRASLTFDGSSTYTLGVPFGQNSVFVLECYGCADEQEVVAVTSVFEVSSFEEFLKDTESDTGVGTGADKYIAAASGSYSSKDLESTRYSLQKALEEVDIIIGKKILEMLPTELAGLKAIPDEDEHIASTAGFAGVYIQRRYYSTDTTKQIEITLMDDSPLIAMVNTFVNTPMMMGISGKKSIKIDGYKGMYEPVENSSPQEVNINIPSNQTLLTMRFTGMDEPSVNGAANKVPVGGIFKMLK